MFNEKEEKRNQWLVAVGCILVFVAMFASQCKGQIRVFRDSIQTRTADVFNDNNFIYTLLVEKHSKDSVYPEFNIRVVGKKKTLVRNVSFYFQESDSRFTYVRKFNLESRNIIVPINESLLKLLYNEPLTEITVRCEDEILQGFYADGQSHIFNLQDKISIFKDLLHRVGDE